MKRRRRSRRTVLGCSSVRCCAEYMSMFLCVFDVFHRMLNRDNIPTVTKHRIDVSMFLFRCFNVFQCFSMLPLRFSMFFNVFLCFFGVFCESLARER